ncbi:MAG: hypothetical protein HC794_05035 [Nitrospiraceae bacterium]|nr:hypothetical protein [Nitrospiraceae bacterium]
MMDFGLLIGSIFGGCLLTVYLVGFFMPSVTNRVMLWGIGASIVRQHLPHLKRNGLAAPRFGF